MLQEPMMEKLTTMRLLGMVDALKAQEQDPAAGELSFLERLGLLVGSAVDLAREPGPGAAIACR
jgi:hypothetical protein